MPSVVMLGRAHLVARISSQYLIYLCINLSFRPKRFSKFSHFIYAGVNAVMPPTIEKVLERWWDLVAP